MVHGEIPTFHHACFIAEEIEALRGSHAQGNHLKKPQQKAPSCPRGVPVLGYRGALLHPAFPADDRGQWRGLARGRCPVLGHGMDVPTQPCPSAQLEGLMLF